MWFAALCHLPSPPQKLNNVTNIHTFQVIDTSIPISSFNPISNPPTKPRQMRKLAQIYLRKLSKVTELGNGRGGKT